MEEKRWTISRIADSEHHLDMVRGPDTGGLIEVCPVTELEAAKQRIAELEGKHRAARQAANHAQFLNDYRRVEAERAKIRRQNEGRAYE